MFNGSCVALVTPMSSDGAIDFNAVRALIEWHIAQGSQALVMAGTTGESATLEHDEFELLLQIAVETAAGRIPIIAGTGTNSTASTIEKTERAKQLGCDGALIVTPYYNRPTQEGLYLHYEAVAKAVSLPILLYNVPSRTACDLKTETVARLSRIKNIVGLKEATGDLGRVATLKEACEHPFKLYSGDDASALDFMKLGGHGVISVAANVAPASVQSLCQLVLNHSYEEAQQVDQSLSALYELLFIESNPIPVKWAMMSMGLISSGIRLPLTPLSLVHQRPMSNVLKHLGAMHA